MSASQIKALNNYASENEAVSTGFNTSILVLCGFVLAGVILALFLSYKAIKTSQSSNTKLAGI